MRLYYFLFYRVHIPARIYFRTSVSFPSLSQCHIIVSGLDLPRSDTYYLNVTSRVSVTVDPSVLPIRDPVYET